MKKLNTMTTSHWKKKKKKLQKEKILLKVSKNKKTGIKMNQDKPPSYPELLFISMNAPMLSLSQYMSLGRIDHIISLCTIATQGYLREEKIHTNLKGGCTEEP